MKRNRIILTESQLHRLIKESINKLMFENNDFYDDMVSAPIEQLDGTNSIMDAFYAARRKFAPNENDLNVSFHYNKIYGCGDPKIVKSIFKEIEKYGWDLNAYDAWISDNVDDDGTVEFEIG